MCWGFLFYQSPYTASDISYNISMKPIVLCGPTASGKTELALELARQTGGMIISADSRQVYKRLTIGTAKPQGVWQNGQYLVDGIAYHLVNFLEVTDIFNAGDFCTRVHSLTHQDPQIPLIFAGGTGMYLHAYFVGMDDLPASTPQSRKQLEQLLQQYGKEGLHQLLRQKDPLSATQIPVGNVQRTMRALELYLLTGKPASELKSGQFFKLPNPAESHWVYLDWARDVLAERINTRTKQIFPGMCAEARQLLLEGFSSQTPALKSLGYPQAIECIRGTLSSENALEKITTLTRQYAKRQRTWFNRYTQAQRIALNAHADFEPKKLAQAILACANR